MNKTLTGVTLAATLLFGACGSDSNEPERTLRETTTTTEGDRPEPTTSVESTNSKKNVGPVNVSVNEQNGLFHLLWDAPVNGQVTLQANNQTMEYAAYLPDGTVNYWNYGQTILFNQTPGITDTLSTYVEQYEKLFNEYNSVEAWVRKDLPDPWEGIHSASIGQLVTTLLVPESPLTAATPGCVTEFDNFQRTFAEAVPEPTWIPTANRTETWTVPVSDLPYELLPACTGTDSDEYRSLNETLTVERTPERTTVFYQSAIYMDSEPEPVFTLTPISKEPTSSLDTVKGERLKLFDPVTWFLTAANRCGELPYSYSNFAAGNSYTSPEHPNYIEPNPFVSYYVCVNELPDDAANTSQGNTEN